MLRWNWTCNALLLLLVSSGLWVRADHLVPLDVIDTPGSNRVSGDERSDETMEVVPYHELFTALLKKLELFRKSDPFLMDHGSHFDSSLQPAPERNTKEPKAQFHPHLVPHGPKHPFKPSLEHFDRALAQLKASPAQPVHIRRFFVSRDPKITEFADLSRRYLFAKEFNLSNEACPKRPPPRCDPGFPYRTYDGVCNNLEHPFWGSFSHFFQRFLRPDYSDGRAIPRGSQYSFKTGYVSTLPNPRKISVNFHTNRNISDPTHSHMLMQFAQFIDHDITGLARDDFDCCQPEFQKSFLCFPVDLRGDPIFSKFNRTCMTLSRASWNCRANLPWVEQFSGTTSFLDASTIYGSNQERAFLLRGGDSRRDGKLFENPRLNRFNIPTRLDLGMASELHESETDFISGDSRNIVQPTLLSLQNVFLLEHNRIAGGLLRAMRGKLDHLEAYIKDEILFQESRRILIAQLQSIVYQEFLPSFIPRHELQKHGVHFMADCEYQPQIDPTVRNEFSTAAYRFGHSLVQDIFQGRKQPWRLSNGFADPTFATKHDGLGFENEISGVCSQSQQVSDRFVASELTNKLFANKKLLGQKKALQAAADLVATNIQRGRDHGLPGYNSFRKLVGLRRIQSLSDQPEEVSWPSWERLAKLYRRPDDIDIFTGGLAEDPLPGGLLGPTFNWIITEQFRYLMHGDRFFFTHSRGRHAKGLPRILQPMIMSRRLSDIICENTRTISTLQRNAFFLSNAGEGSERNLVVSCKDRARSKLNFDLIAISILEERHLLNAKDEKMLKEALAANESQTESDAEMKGEEFRECVHCQATGARTPEDVSLDQIARSDLGMDGSLACRENCDEHREMTEKPLKHEEFEDNIKTCVTCHEESSFKPELGHSHAIEEICPTCNSAEQLNLGLEEPLEMHESSQPSLHMDQNAIISGTPENEGSHEEYPGFIENHDGSVPEDSHEDHNVIGFGTWEKDHGFIESDQESISPAFENPMTLEVRSSEERHQEFVESHDGSVLAEAHEDNNLMEFGTPEKESSEESYHGFMGSQDSSMQENSITQTYEGDPDRSEFETPQNVITFEKYHGHVESHDSLAQEDSIPQAYEADRKGETKQAWSKEQRYDEYPELGHGGNDVKHMGQEPLDEVYPTSLAERSDMREYNAETLRDITGNFNDGGSEHRNMEQIRSQGGNSLEFKESSDDEWSSPINEAGPSADSNRNLNQDSLDWNEITQEPIQSMDLNQSEGELDQALDNEPFPMRQELFESNDGDMQLGDEFMEPSPAGLDPEDTKHFQPDGGHSFEFSPVDPAIDDANSAQDIPSGSQEGSFQIEDDEPSGLMADRVIADQEMISSDMELLHPIDDVPTGERVESATNFDGGSNLAELEKEPDSDKVKKELWTSRLEHNDEVEWNSLLSDRVMESHPMEQWGSETPDSSFMEPTDMANNVMDDEEIRAHSSMGDMTDSFKSGPEGQALSH